MYKMRRNMRAIVAVCDDWGIGRAGDMVVANRADMRHFVRKTTGHTVIMGRRTLQSFPGARPLKNRRNIVLTRSEGIGGDGVEIARSIEDALSLVAPDEEAWIIGGADVYRQLLPCCCEAVVTKNHCVRPADAFFPNLDLDPSWRVVERGGLQEIGPGEGDEGVSFEFVTYRHEGESE